ncbi:MAG: 1-acyl-sn-glycerol-3-phosphate acyltransferase [Bacteroidales bacterium]|nr:1-acyl-sn-glycerol-3-phosphate acyltransferase [Bacteroidales bacterium]
MEKISIRKAFQEKNPKVAKILPNFVYQHIERIVHQKEINDSIPILGDKYGLDFVKAVLDFFEIKIIVIGKENIPREGRNIFSANHPLGGIDGGVLSHVVGEIFPDIRFLVNDLLMNFDNADPIFIPVNKHGKQSIEYVRRIEETYKSDMQMLNFPAGLCSRKIHGKIIDLEWKKSFITKAVQHKRNIVPVHIKGKNSNFFYNLSNLRNAIGIKTNIEMFYLSDEVFKQKGKTITLTFGKPIPYQTFDKSMPPKEWAKKVKDYVYQLGEGSFEAFK